MKRIGLLTLVGLLAACSTTKEAEDFTEKASQESSLAMEAARPEQHAAEGGGVKVKDGVWLGATSISYSEAEKLPAPWNQHKELVLKQSGDLRSVADRITQITGVQIRVDTIGDAYSFVDFEGPLPMLFNDLASANDLTWRVQNGEVVFEGLQTQTFFIHALPVNSTHSTTFDATAQSDGGTSSSGGGSDSSANLSSSSQIKLNPWASVTKTIAAIAAIKEEGVIVNPEAGTVTVTATPAKLRNVDRWVKKKNEKLLSQVAIHVKAITVTVDANDSYGVNLALAFQNATLAVGGASPTFDLVPGAGNLNLGIIGDSDFAGTEAIAHAISDQGDNALIRNLTLHTLNNTAVPAQIGRQITYIQSISQTDTANVGSTASINPGVVNDGIFVNILPRILSDGRVILHATLTFNQLISLDEVSATTGDDSPQIQAPRLNRQNVQQNIVMKSGQTLVMAGFETDAAETTATGVGEASWWYFGGGVNATKRKEVTVIMMTPVVSGGLGA